MANILCIETATDVCSVAIGSDRQIITEEHISEGMRHSVALTTLIDQAVAKASLSPSHLDAVAISDGPGSYTGLRVGASAAKAICYAHDIPLIAIPTLSSIARSIDTTLPVMATLDARRMEVYASVYDEAHNEKEPVQSVIWSEEYVQDLVSRHPELVIAGTGVIKAQELFDRYPALSYHEIECRAFYMVPEAYEKYSRQDFVDIAYHSPFYFKMPNITTPKKRF